jgi:hypothetical protein
MMWDSSGDKLVTFSIGKEEKEFQVHKAFACHYSPVLKAAFNNPTFEEGQTQMYRLEDTTEAPFSLLIEWVYSQTLEYHEGSTDLTTPNLVRLWVLAGYLLIPRLQNVAIDLIDVVISGKGGSAITELVYVYEKTTEDSALRRYFVDVCLKMVGCSTLRKYPRFFPQQMLLDLAIAQKDRIIFLQGNTFYPTGAAAFHVLEEEGKI